jgi:hypothetical protein
MSFALVMTASCAVARIGDAGRPVVTWASELAADLAACKPYVMYVAFGIVCAAMPLTLTG